MCHLPSPLNLVNYRNYFVHDGCLHNVADALVRRVGLCTPYTVESRVRHLMKLAKELGRSIGGVQVMSYQEVIDCYDGYKRRRYERALEEIERYGVSYNGKLTVFVKQEGIEYRPGKVNPACRAIQFRPPPYTLHLSTFIKPLEHRLSRVMTGKSFPNTVCMAKTATPRERARVIRQKIASMPGCWVLELDASRFDAHVNVDLLKVEHTVYNYVFRDFTLKRLLKQQLFNKGSCRRPEGKIKYSLNGGRGSGDANTGCGNWIIMFLMLVNFGQDISKKILVEWAGRRRQFDIYCDGDDSLFFYTGPKLDDAYIKRFFTDCGMTIKVDNHTREYHTVGFCQSRIVDTHTGPILVRDPIKILVKTLINPKFKLVSMRAKLLNTIAMGELSIYRGVPILDPFFRCLRRIARSHMSRRMRIKGEYLKGGFWKDYRLSRDVPTDWKIDRVVPITREARVSFQQVWGFDISEQLELEKRFETFTFDLNGQAIEGDGVDVKRWLFDAFYPESTGQVSYRWDPHLYL